MTMTMTVTMQLLALCVLGCLVTGVHPQHHHGHHHKHHRGSKSDASTKSSAGGVSFLVMGDWGGQPSRPYTTGAEIATAGGMGKAVAETAATFALALGDNFYDSGVRSVSDPRFNATFENVFTSEALQDPFKFHVIAGNHDHGGDVGAQIQYSSVSPRWDFPSEWYTFTETGADGTTVQFVMIDTVVLSGMSDVRDEQTQEILSALTGSELKRAEQHEEMAQSQLQFIEDTLSKSTADFLIVAGHYPVYSICEHGPTSELITDLQPLLEKYDATAYMNGHDHCAQLIRLDSSTVDYHTIGSAHENNPSTAHQSAIPSGSLQWHTGRGKGGFAKVYASKSEGMTVVHCDGDGSVLYTAKAHPPRQTGEVPVASK